MRGFGTGDLRIVCGYIYIWVYYQLVNGNVGLVETTYHKKKIYVPAEVRKRIGLREGDKLTVAVLDRKSFKVELKRKTAEEQILDALTNAREVGVPSGLTRREIYEDIG